jgi:hypothetical protein
MSSISIIQTTKQRFIFNLISYLAYNFKTMQSTEFNDRIYTLIFEAKCLNINIRRMLFNYILNMYIQKKYENLHFFVSFFLLCYKSKLILYINDKLQKRKN